MSKLDTCAPESTSDSLSCECAEQWASAQHSRTRQLQASPCLCANNPRNPELQWHEMRFHTAQVNEKLTAHENSVLAVPERQLQISTLMLSRAPSKHNYTLQLKFSIPWAKGKFQFKDFISTSFCSPLPLMKSNPWRLNTYCVPGWIFQVQSWRTLQHKGQSSGFVTCPSVCQCNQQEMQWPWGFTYFPPTTFSKLRELGSRDIPEGR